MVAQFLRLKLRLLVNVYRRSPWQLLGIILGTVYGFGAAFLTASGLSALRLADVEFARSIVVVIGSLIVVGFLVLPLAFGADDTVDPRAFSLLGIPSRRLAAGLAAAAFVSVPAGVVAVIALAQVVTWSRGPLAVFFALLAGVFILCTCVLGARVMTSVAALFLATRRAREATGLITLLVLGALSPLIAVLVTIDWDVRGVGMLVAMADVLGWTPLGAAWSAPADAAAGDPGLAVLKLLIATAFLGLLWLAWRRIVSVMLVTPDRQSRSREYTGLGWFARLPGTPAGVIAARSLSYWARDARYRASLVIVPIVPLAMIGILLTAGVSLDLLLLLPVPIMCFFLAWSTVHNDIAYDNTALWLHVAANTTGRDDRLGRIVPPLAIGLLLILIGAPLSALPFGGVEATASVIGVSLCVLLAGLGLSSIISAAFPYPAVHPGDGPFAQPQSSATGASWVQALSLVGVLVITAPTVLLAVLALAGDPGWHVGALLLGTTTGVAVLIGGILLGGKVYDARAPELLAFTMRY